MGWYETLKEVLSNPDGFYKNMNVAGGFGEPLKFAVINFAIYGFFYGVLLAIGLSLKEFMSIPGLGGLGWLAIPGAVIGMVIVGAIALFIMAVIMHVLLLIVGGKGTYEGTFRAMAYATAVGVLSWIPLVGILAVIYGIYLEVVGYSYVHKISKGRAFIAILIPLIVILLLVIVGLLAFLSIGNMMNTALH